MANENTAVVNRENKCQIMACFYSMDFRQKLAFEHQLAMYLLDTWHA